MFNRKKFQNFISASSALPRSPIKAMLQRNGINANAHKTPHNQGETTRQGNHTNQSPNSPKTANYGVLSGQSSSRPHQSSQNRQHRHQNQRQRADLERLPLPVDFYSRFLSLKGGGQWRLALCPFHQDKRPSLSINTLHGGYICHTCGAKGDRIRFYMEFMGVDFVQACKDLGLYDE